MDEPDSSVYDGLTDRALASETRKQILRSLAERNHRPSDLSRELGKDKSTIVQHLEVLNNAGLVERIEREGHKWIFYRLSKKAEAFFPNQRRRIAFFVLALISLLGAFASFMISSQQAQQFRAPDFVGANQEAMPSKTAAAPEQAAGAAAILQTNISSGEQQPAQQPAGGEFYLYIALALSLAFIASVARFLLTRTNELVLPRRKK